jgi:glycosyltransferase involved in cell wall biosynthesis
LRVLMISKACVVGSYQRKLEELAAFPDVDLTVLVPTEWRDERGVLPLERAYTHGYELIARPLAFNGHFHLHFFPGLSGLVRRLRPDVVHIDEEPYNLATGQAVRAGRRVGARTVFFTWQNLRRRYPPPFAWIERYVLSVADYALAGNRDAVGVWRNKGYRGPIKVVRQFGVDPDLFAFHRPSPLAGRPLVIGYVGRWVAEKGVDLLLHAVAGMADDTAIQILGSGPAEVGLRALVERLGLATRVEFLPPIPSVDMPRFMPRLDVLVLPSRARPNWTEQFGRVLIEAMACGVPVVGSDCGEIPDVIGDAGLIFRQDDVDGLRSSLARLRDDDLRLRLAQAGRTRVEAHFTQARVAAQTREVYLEMMRG